MAVLTAAPARMTALFHALAERWRDETKFASSTTEIVLHPSYQRIIGFGPQVLPLIFEQLERVPEPWFWALTALTGENPIPAEDVGRTRRMAEHWLQWGRVNGWHG